MLIKLNIFSHAIGFMVAADSTEYTDYFTTIYTNVLKPEHFVNILDNSYIFNRPGVAGAILQTPLSFIT